jgi:copper transport protein
VDGHTVKGFIVFSVGEATIPAGASQGGQEAGLQKTAIPEMVLRWLNYLGLMVLTGCSGVLLFVLRPASTTNNLQPVASTAFQPARARILKLALFTAEFTFLMGPALLIWQVVSLAEVMQGNLSIFQLTKQVVLGTTWGHAWLAREALLAILAILFIRLLIADKPKRSSLILAMALTLGSLAAQSVVSHAAAGGGSDLPILVDFLHLVFAGLWMGGLIALVVGLLPVLLQDNSNFKELVRITWGPFSRLAALSVGVVVATGIYSTGRQVISADALVLNPYGKILSAKVSLVLFAGVFGLMNSVLLHPNLAAPLARLLKKPDGWTPLNINRFPVLVLVETILGLLVVLLAGALTSIPPARSVAYTIDPKGQPDSLSTYVNDLIVTLSIKPNRPGANLFNVVVINTRRPPPAEILRVIVKLTYLDQDIGTTTQDAEFVGQGIGMNTYRLGGSHLTQPGRWKIDVLVRRKGLPDSQADFSWTVLPFGEIPPLVLSHYPWTNDLTVIAGLIAAFVVILSGLILFRKMIVKSHQAPSDKAG